MRLWALCSGLWLAALWLPQRAAADGPELCVVGRLTSSAFSALRYQRTPSVGCFSRRVTHTGQEVHVIRLDTGRAGQRQRQGRPRVELNVRAPTDGRSYSREIVLVLDATSSVDWSIYGRNGFRNGTSFEIIVTKRSRVVRSDLSPLQITSQHVRSRKALIKLVMTRLRAFTSFTDVSAADTIDLTVGIDLDAPDTCDPESHMRPGGGLVSRLVRPVRLDGCYHHHLAGLGQRDVYLLEVTDDSDEFRNSRVVINLLPSGDKKSATGNLTLILKSAVPVTWQLEAGGYAGDVLVLTESPAKNGSLGPGVSLEVRQVRLPKSFNDLIIYAVGYSSGPPVAYIRAPALDRLDIRLEHSAADDTPAGDEARSSDDRWLSLDPSLADMAAGADSASGRLRRAVSVSCAGGRLVVAVPAPAAAAVSVAALHLADWRCRSVTNGSHLVVSQPLAECGTERRTVDHRTVYVNTVHFVPAAPPQDDEDFEGSGGGADGGADLWAPQLSGGSVPLRCSVPEDEPEDDPQGQGISVDIGEVGPSVYSLELSDNPHFTNPIKPNLLVPVSHSLYVRSALHMASYLRPVLERCWVSGSGEPTAPAALPLVTAGCPAADTVTALPAARDGSAIFRFQVTRQFAELGPFYLHCEMGVCAGPDSPARRHIVRCRAEPDRRCPAAADRRRASGLQVITRGPLLSAETGRSGAAEAAGRRPVLQLGVSHETVAGVGVAAFLLGVLLMGGVWLIHSKIGPTKRHQFQAVPQNPSLEVVGQSANSTPNSQTPIILAGRSPSPVVV